MILINNPENLPIFKKHPSIARRMSLKACIFHEKKGGHILESIPDDWGHKVTLDGAAIAITSVGPNSINIKTSAYLILIMLAPQSRRHLSLNSDRSFFGVAPVGALEVVPKGFDLFSRWESHKENFLAIFDGHRLEKLAGKEFNQSSFEFHPPRIGLLDSKALEIAKNIQNEIRMDDAAMSEAIDAWMTLLGVHVLREYSNLNKKSGLLFKGGLSPRAWARVDDYIRVHLSGKIKMEDLAEIAQLSPSHFSRSFRQTVGHSPHQYVMDLRLKTARDLIERTNGAFDEISKLSGFSSNSHMTATMRRFWGVKPMQLRRRRSN